MFTLVALGKVSALLKICVQQTFVCINFFEENELACSPIQFRMQCESTSMMPPAGITRENVSCVLYFGIL